MPSATTISIDLDLAAIEDAVGVTSFRRGRAYARGKGVLSISWDEGSALLSGRVVGQGALYDTAAYFRSDGEALEFEEGECSCPTGFNCKHVAALAIAATRPVASRRAAATAPARNRRARSGAGENERAPSPVRAPSWEAPLRAMLAVPAPQASGVRLAIELSVRFVSSGSTVGRPRLHARLMRPGVRGGWVNGSLLWSELDSWQTRDGGYREDHLALAREFHALERARIAASNRYYYGYRSTERALDLTAWDSAQLWALLDEAARLGVATVHAPSHLGALPRHRRGELLLDVTAGPDGGARVGPALRVDGAGDLEGFEPLLFLGDAGHGIVMVQVRDGPGARNAVEPARDVPVTGLGDLTSRPLRLVRLARETPSVLQAMVLDGETLDIPAADLQTFTVELAPGLRNVAPVVSSDGSFVTPEVSAPELVLRVHHDDDHLTRVAWGWRYLVGGDAVEFALGVNGEGPGMRDLDAERAVLDGLDLGGSGLTAVGLLDGDARPTDGARLLDGFDTVRFVGETLPGLQAVPGLTLDVRGESLDYRDVDDSLQVGISTREISGERDWFDLDLTILVEGRELAFAEVFARLARGETRMLLEDGAHFSLLTSELETLRELIEEARALGDASRSTSLRISRYQASLWQELVVLGIVREQAEGWQRQVDALHQLEAVPQHEPPAGLAGSLRPYQLDGFRWLATLWDLGLGGILADDMGLGKTLQALALVAHARAGGETRPFLVVAPTSVAPNWAAEVARFTPALTVRTVTDTFARAGASIEEVLTDTDVVVTTYTLLRLDADDYTAVTWAGVILDEAQLVKNHSGKTHQATRRLQAKSKIAVTGTPMENNLTELWALLSIVAPGLFPDPKAFAEHYARPIERRRDGERLARLRRRIRPLVQRRTKELVAADLPAKQEQSLEVELHPRHRKLYDTWLQRERQRILGLLDDFDRHRFTILTAITRLRQLSLHAGLVDDRHRSVPSAKLDALAGQLADVAGSGHRALVFSQFTGFLDLVRERLDKEGIGYCYLDGQTRGRAKALERFKAGDEPAFLISLKAGGFGLNLTEADYCFLLDPWWNPATEAQAIDRAHRIGQARTVMAYRLVARDTIEQKVVALARRKAALFRGVLDDGDQFAGAITAEDIRGLLS